MYGSPSGTHVAENDGGSDGDSSEAGGAAGQSGGALELNERQSSTDSNTPGGFDVEMGRRRGDGLTPITIASSSSDDTRQRGAAVARGRHSPHYTALDGEEDGYNDAV